MLLQQPQRREREWERAGEPEGEKGCATVDKQQVGKLFSALWMMCDHDGLRLNARTLILLS